MKCFGFGSQGLALSTSSSPVDLSFEDLAMPQLDSLHNFAHWLTHNRPDAEDLVQETYLKALRSFASFQPGTNFRAWIFRILKNTFLSSCSRLERRMTVATGPEEDAPELAVENETPETVLMKRSDSNRVQSAIENLPVHYQETLLLCDVEEMSYREISDVLSVPLGTVMSRLARARKSVRESLCHEWSGGSPSRDSSISSNRRGIHFGEATNKSDCKRKYEYTNEVPSGVAKTEDEMEDTSGKTPAGSRGSSCWTRVCRPEASSIR
jgi:RNA polymerase sigma factor (sigma-70 family)